MSKEENKELVASGSQAIQDNPMMVVGISLLIALATMAVATLVCLLLVAVLVVA